MGGLVAMLMPAIHAAREVARRSSCELNQRRIGVIGMMGHHDAFDKLPDNTFGEDGAELHSWRTKILPFMDSYASSLHGRYDHEKPWNAPENSFARDASLDMYHCRSKPAEASLNRSDYLTIYADPATRPQPVFTKGAAVRFRDIVDGMSNTIMVVESSTGVEWVSVNDFAFETMPMSVREGAGAKGISSYHMGGANVLMADGSQQFLPVSINKDVLKALITRNGGERPFMGF